jgi:hypothetical protein
LPALAKTTSYVYKGDEEAARKLLGLANLQLMKLRNLMAFNNLEQYALTVYNKVGAYIKVSSIFGNEVAEVFYPKIKGVPEEVLKRKRIMRMKIAQDWTILYAPTPLPDPQDWGGWMESGKSDLIVDNFLNVFGLIGFGWPVWGDFIAEGDLSTHVTSPTKSCQDGGWVCIGYGQGVWASPTPSGPAYRGPIWEAIGIGRNNRSLSQQSFYYTFVNDLIPQQPVTNWTESGSKKWVMAGGGYQTKGFVWIPSNGFGSPTPPVITEADVTPAGPYDPGYALTHGEGFISWQSMYMLGFWKQEWTPYNPSSYLDNDNYIVFYDKYVYDSSYSATYLSTYGFSFVSNMYEWMFPGADGYYASVWTETMRNDYIASPLGSGSTNNITFPHSEVIHGYFGGSITVYDPDSDGAGGSVGTITYETHACGKYEGVAFDEVIGTATFSGTAAWIGSWTGDNIFPFMGRMYAKEDLKEGTTDEHDKTSEHNLLLYSYLKGPAAGGASSTNKVPGCSGITQTVYRMRHGATNITKTYVASHPGWHTVWTDPSTGRLWRAYGDLFAALKATSIKDIELGQPEWIDWWYADGSKFIIEEDDN